MGSPTCPTCGSPDRRQDSPGRVFINGTPYPVCRDPWHATPPAPAYCESHGGTGSWRDCPTCIATQHPAPADDAGGAAAMREASVHSGEASKRATAFVEAMDASPCPHSDADWSESDCGYCLAAALDRFAATPLPATDDAVEEAMAPGCHEHVALWDAINAYSAACGGHPTRGGGARMDAVVRVEKALRAALRREKGGGK